jgi:hypothetical protein
MTDKMSTAKHTPVKTYSDLTDAQQRVLCELAAGPTSYNGRMQRVIDNLSSWGLIASDYDLLFSGSRRGAARWSIKCEITELGRKVLFDEVSSTVISKEEGGAR